MNQIYLTLPSNSSEKYFPKNTLSNFTTQLHHPVELEAGEWEVGLSEIVYPHNWFNVKNDAEATVYVYHQVDDNIMMYKLNLGYYAKVPDLVKALNDLLKGYANFKWWEPSQRVFAKGETGFKVILPQTLANMLGLPRHLSSAFVITGKELADTKRGLHSMYVYCDLVEHQLVGDSLVPLLRIVAVRGKNGDVITRTYEHIQYAPCRGGKIQTVEIDIRDDTGQPVPFEAGRVVVILHLRRVRA